MNKRSEELMDEVERRANLDPKSRVPWTTWGAVGKELELPPEIANWTMDHCLDRFEVVFEHEDGNGFTDDDFTTLYERCVEGDHSPSPLEDNSRVFYALK